jgi:membrane-bound serine protease (ClpP class)
VTGLGIALLLLGATLIVVETHVPSLGFLGAPGVVALIAGSVLAVSGLGGGTALVIAVTLILALVALAGLALAMRKGGAARRRRIRTGAEGLVGRHAVVRSWGERGGRVQLEGALWRARPAWPQLEQGQPQEGDIVVVEQLHGLTLAVRSAEDWEQLA